MSVVPSVVACVSVVACGRSRVDLWLEVHESRPGDGRDWVDVPRRAGEQPVPAGAAAGVANPIVGVGGGMAVGITSIGIIRDANMRLLA
jgi:hypothetical protein